MGLCTNKKNLRGHHPDVAWNIFSQVLGPNPTSNQVPGWGFSLVEVDQKQAKRSTPGEEKSFSLLIWNPQKRPWYTLGSVHFRDCYDIIDKEDSNTFGKVPSLTKRLCKGKRCICAGMRDKRQRVGIPILEGPSAYTSCLYNVRKPWPELFSAGL